MESFPPPAADGSCYRALLENLPVPVIVTRVSDGRFLYSNGMAERKFGFEWGEADGLVGQDFWVDARPRSLYLLQLEEKGRLDNCEIELFGRDRKPFWALACVQKILWEGVPAICAVFSDITERHVHEKALQESEQYSHRLFSESRIPMMILDPETNRFLDSNPAAARLYGHSDREAIIGRTPGDLSPPLQYDGSESGPAAAARIRACMEHGEHLFQWRHRRQDGSLWDAEIHLVRFVHDGRPLVQLTLSDITRRLRAESELRESEEKFRILFERSMDAILILDNGRFVDCNRAALDMMRSNSKESLLQMQPSWISPPVQPDGSPSEEAASVISGIAHDQGMHRFEWMHRRMDGEDFPVEVTMLKVPLGGREVFYVMWRDISRQKQVERELVAAKEEAEAAARARTEFLANISHEIRTPLNAVIGFSELLRTGVRDESLQRYAEAIRVAGSSLLSLLNDILDLSRIEAGRMILCQETVDLSHLLREIAQVFLVSAETKGIDILVNLDASIPPGLQLDGARLRQALLNVVGNAVKFTQRGSVEIRSEAVPCTRAEGDLDILVQVRDTGIGIPPEALPRIFDAFTQATSQSDRIYGGSGLGLAITRKLLELMDGDIGVTENEGGGSLFAIRLRGVRVIPGFLPPSETASSAWDGRSVPARILVADRVASNGDLICAILEREGHHVCCPVADSDWTGILGEWRGDLAIVDPGLKIGAGRNLAEALRMQSRLAGIPVLACSSAPPSDGDSRFVGWIPKPIGSVTLLREVERHLRLIDAGHFPPQKVSEAEDGAPSLSAFLDAEEKAHLAHVLVPLLRLLRTAIRKDGARELARILSEEGDRLHLPCLKESGDVLEEAVRRFDVLAILHSLERLPDVLRGLGIEEES